MRPGVRCADTTPTSNGTSNSASAVAASSMTDQSLSLPMITPTRAVRAVDSSRKRSSPVSSSRKSSSVAMLIPSVRPLAM
jgi:hypothetical protein